jgi:uncharacterized membrane protein YhfC
MAAESALIVQLVLVVAVVTGASIWTVRRFRASWVVWFAGGASWIVVALFIYAPSGRALGFAPALAAVAGGALAEGARYVALRWMIKRARKARDGIVFGVGFGGIEALAVVGITVVGSLLLITFSGPLLEVAREAQSEAGELLEEMIAAAQATTLSESLANVSGAITMIIVHVGLTLMVLRAVTQHAPRWVVVAALFHMAVSPVFGMSPQIGVWPTQGVLAVFALASALIIRTAWRNRAAWYEEPAASERARGLSGAGEP